MNRPTKYLIKWRGYNLEDATWENADNLNNAQLAVYEYHKRIDNQQRHRLLSRPMNSRTTRAVHIAQRQSTQLNRVGAHRQLSSSNRQQANNNEYIEAPDREIIRQKCESQCKNGCQLCKRTTIKGDKCLTHSSRDYNLRIKKSNIKDSGFGLFVATRPIRKGEIITKYSGKISYNPTYGKYVLEAAGKYINANKSDCYGSYANDCRASNRRLHQCKQNNARFKITNDGSVDIVAIKDINKNEEIFISYGRQYWNDFDRYNRQLKEAIRRSLIDQRRTTNNNNINNRPTNQHQSKPIQRRSSRYTIRIINS
jgi:hypothetical protein